MTRPFSAITRLPTLLLTIGILAGCSQVTDDNTIPSGVTSSTTAHPSTPTTPTHTPTSTATTAAPELTVTGPGTLCRDQHSLKPFTGPAADTFGADGVLQAYCTIGEFLHLNAVTNATPPRERYTAEELSFVKEIMTPEAQQDWDAIVGEYLAAGTKQAYQDINSLIYFNLGAVHEQGFTFPAPGDRPMTLGGDVSEAETRVHELPNGDEALYLGFTLTTNIVLVKQGAEHVLPVERVLAIHALPTPDPARPWLIDSWNSTWTAQPPVPLTQFRAEQTTS